MREALHTIGDDLRMAVRSLRRAPLITSLAVAVLAVTIGANTAVFSVVESVLLRPLPFPEDERLVDVKQVQRDERATAAGGSTSPLFAFEAWKAQRAPFANLAAYVFDEPVYTGSGYAERASTWIVSSDFFRTLQAPMAHGRGFVPKDDAPGAAPVVVLSHGFWVSRLGADPGVLGTRVDLDGDPYTVIGVLQRGFEYPPGVQLWRALGPYLAGPQGPERASAFGFWVVGRLRPGVDARNAEAGLEGASLELGRLHPTYAGWVPFLRPLREFYVGPSRRPLVLIQSAVILVLLVGCANVGTLMLAKAVSKERDVALRAALGATPARLWRFWLTEAVVLTCTGAVFGLGLAAFLAPRLRALTAVEFPGLGPEPMNLAVLAGTLVAVAMATVVAAAVPAIRGHESTLPSALRVGIGARAQRALTGGLVVAQLALTVLLLIGAVRLGHSFLSLLQVDLGFQSDRHLVAELQLTDDRYRDREHRAVVASELLRQIQALPGVSVAALGSSLPFASGTITSVAIPDQPTGGTLPSAWVANVTHQYFTALGIPLRKGRLFDERIPEPDALVLDEAAARAYFPGTEALGRPLQFGGRRLGKVIGIVGDVRQETLQDDFQPHLYRAMPTAGAPAHLKIIVRTVGDPTALAASLRRVVATVDPALPVDRITTMEALLAGSLSRQRPYVTLLLSFAGAALVIAASGIYGVLYHGVTQRTREIGVRMALGATRSNVVWMVVQRSLAMTFGGLGLGLVGALAAASSLEALVPMQSGSSLSIATSVAIILGGAVALATYFPAQRAAAVDPMIAIRSE